MRIRFSRQRGPCTVQHCPAPLKEERWNRPPPARKALGHDESPVHNWRVSQLKRLGVPGPLAENYADRIDWHQMARLVRCGCPPRLALRIVG